MDRARRRLTPVLIGLDAWALVLNLLQGAGASPADMQLLAPTAAAGVLAALYAIKVIRDGVRDERARTKDKLGEEAA